MTINENISYPVFKSTEHDLRKILCSKSITSRSFSLTERESIRSQESFYLLITNIIFLLVLCPLKNASILSPSYKFWENISQSAVFSNHALRTKMLTNIFNS